MKLVKQQLDEYLNIARRNQELCTAQASQATDRYFTLQRQRNTISVEERSKAGALRAHAAVAAEVAFAAGSSLERLDSDVQSLHAVLHHHTVEEAERGICDAVLLNFIFGQSEKDKKDVSLLCGRLSLTGSNIITLGSSSSSQSTSSLESSHTNQYDTYTAAPGKMDCPASRTETDNDSVTRHQPKEIMGLPQGVALYIPRLVVENKKPSDKNRKRSLNQCRAYCVASVQFLAYLGVCRHPVFGAAIDGKICYVLMAWTDEQGVRASICIPPRYLTFAQTTFLFDREVRTFDITVPIQALQYMMFLLRLKREADEQEAELTRKILTHFRASQTQSAAQKPRSWTKAAQMKEFPKFHTPPPPPKTPNRPKNEVSSRKGATHTV